MNRTPALRGLAAELGAAAQGREWQRLETAARALPERLAGLAAAGPLDKAERAALEQLRTAYSDAEAACAAAAGEVRAHLDAMHNNKEGWIAYALNGAEPGHKQP
jgi:hypothetical protein